MARRLFAALAFTAVALLATMPLIAPGPAEPTAKTQNAPEAAAHTATAEQPPVAIGRRRNAGNKSSPQPETASKNGASWSTWFNPCLAIYLTY